MRAVANARIARLLVGLGAFSPVGYSLATEWSAETHTLAAGDFNGDGRDDLLVIAKDPTQPSGIALADGSGQPSIFHQTWSSNYLGITWSGDAYLPHVGDINGDGHADVFLQRVSGGNHYVLLIDSNDKFTSISQTLSNSHLGINWSQAERRIELGDYNNDGRSDLLLQSKTATTDSAIVLANSSAAYQAVAHNLANLYLNPPSTFKWSVPGSFDYSGDFNYDGYDDILLQAQPEWVLIPYEDLTIPVPVYRAGSYGIVVSDGTGKPTTVHYSWSHDHLGLEWSPLHYEIFIDNFDGACTDDILLQAKRAGGPSYIVLTSCSGQVPVGSTVHTLAAGYLGLNWDATSYDFQVGDYNGDGRADIYMQAVVQGGANRIAATSSTGNITSTPIVHDPAWLSLYTPGTAAGFTPGEFSIDPSGAATYRIPLTIVPGSGGVQPDIALAYSSRAGNGIMGVGWALSGLSGVTRCPATLAESDTYTDGVDLDADDQYCLDGQRLKLVSGSSTEYRTDPDTFQKVVSSGTAGSGPASFTVQDKGGLTRQYGTTADSRIEAAGKPDVLVFALRRTSDVFGNYVQYEYTEGQSMYRPSVIRYGHSGSTEVARIEFTYEGRDDVSRGSIAGSAMVNDQRLARIRTVSGSSPVRDYHLKYHYSPVSNRSVLTAVTECEAVTNKCFDDTGLEWQTGARGFSTMENTGVSDQTFQGLQILDVNNDGRLDWAYVWNNTWTVRLGGPAGPTAYSSLWARGWNDGRVHAMDYNGDGYTDLLQPNGSIVEVVFGDPTWGFGGILTTSLTSSALQDGKTAIADVNGDGRSDVVWVTGNGVGVSLNGSSGFGSPLYYNSTVTYPPPYPVISWSQAQEIDELSIRVVHFDSDGRADLLLGVQDCWQNYMTQESWCYGGMTWSVVSFYPSGSAGYLAEKHRLAVASTPDQYPKILDVNGDGLHDVLTYRSDTSKWHLLVSDGTQLVDRWNAGSATYHVIYDEQLWPAYEPISTPSNDAYPIYPPGSPETQAALTLNAAQLEHALVLDYNQDGKTDLVVNFASNWYVILAEEDSSGNPSLARDLVYTGRSAFSPSLAFVADVGSDGLGDIAFPYQGSWRILHDRGPVADLLDVIEDGLGAQVQISYSPLTAPSVYRGPENFVDDNTAPAFPNAHFAAPMLVADSFTVDNGTSQIKTHYEYKGAKLNRQGRGFLGFSEILARNDNSEIETVNRHRQKHPFIGMVQQAIKRVPYTNAYEPTGVNETLPVDFDSTCNNAPFYCSVLYPINSSYQPPANTWHIVSQATNEFTTHATAGYPHVFRSTELVYPLLDAVGGSQPAAYKRTVVDYQNYDAYGNPGTIISTIDNGSGGDVHSMTTTNAFQNWTSGGQWCLGRLMSTSVVHTRTDYGSGGALTGTRNSSFTYNPSTCVLESETVEPGTAFELKKTYAHDAFGNRRSETVTGADIATRVTQTMYDPSGRFPSTVTNALSQGETQVWDAAHGVRTSLTGPNSLTTFWDYDGFGRPIREESPLTTVFTDTSYGWCGSMVACAASEAVYAVASTGSDGSRTVTELDRLNREVLTRTRGFDGGDVNVRRHYDALNREYLVSAPYKTGEAACYTFTKYDSLNRVIWTWQPAHSGQCDGSVYPFTHDLGNFPYAGKVSSIDHDTIVSGRVETEATGPDGRRVVRVTNAVDRLLRLYEVESGTTISTYYDYDPFGNSTWIKDAENNVTTISYDSRGRFKVGTVDPNMGPWTYDHNVLGELIDQTDAKNQITHHEYDLLGRMKKRVDRYELSVGNNDRRVTEWTYDMAPGASVGKLWEAIGPYRDGDPASSSSYRETYHYDGFGRTEHVVRKIDTEYFWTTTSYDGLGRVSQTGYPATSGGATATYSGAIRHNVERLYNSYGYLNTVRETGGANYWQATAANALGNITHFSLGNGISTIRSYDRATAFMTGMTAGTTAQPTSAVNHVYEWTIGGNLYKRHDNNNNLHETFTYDSLHRLKTVTLNSPVTGGQNVNYEHTYSLTGNILSKQTQNGNYTNYVYASSGPHALDSVNAGGTNRSYSYDANGNMYSGGGRTATYTPYNMPSHIQVTSTGYYSDFNYGADRSRYKHVAFMANGGSGNHTVTTIYVGGAFEKITKTSTGLIEFRHYIEAAGEVVSIFTTWSNSNERTEYLHRDHLGSIVALTGSAGGVVERYAFDPWGKRRDASAWAASAPGSFIFPGFFDRLSRGFTGHEQLDHLGLIHMNGRVYDPEIGRFLTADPFTQFPQSTQGLNRYSYVGNNPLTYTDPSGHFIFALIGLLIGKSIGVAMTWGLMLAGAAVDGYLQTGTLRGALLSVIGAAASYGIGGLDIFQVGFDKPGMLFLKSATLGLVQGTITQVGGGRFKEGFLSTFASSMLTPWSAKSKSIAYGTIKAAVIGGTAAELAGGKFANGASTGAFTYVASVSQDRRSETSAGSEVADWLKEAAEKWGIEVSDLRIIDISQLDVKGLELRTLNYEDGYVITVNGSVKIGPMEVTLDHARLGAGFFYTHSTGDIAEVLVLDQGTAVMRRQFVPASATISNLDIRAVQFGAGGVNLSGSVDYTRTVLGFGSSRTLHFPFNVTSPTATEALNQVQSDFLKHFTGR
jgi:RHS repeat-associated protein